MNTPEPRWVTTLPALPIRPSNGHKGTFGTVMVVGGQPVMPGAAALVGTAALRVGAGLCKLVSCLDTLKVALCIQPSCTGIALENDPQATLAKLDAVDPYQKAVVAYGPGLGLDDARSRLLAELLKGKRPVVLDADGITLLASQPTMRSASGPGPSLVVTPHPGEFTRLAVALGINKSPLDEEERPPAAGELARALRCVVLLKGQGTIVSDGAHFYRNQTGNPAMAAAGSGDVLTGIVAGLIAQGMPTFDATILAAHLHGLAGDIWAAEHGHAGLLAMELAGLIPSAMQAHRADETARRAGPRGR
jgi:NAD(P)H-hydrate epimerase